MILRGVAITGLSIPNAIKRLDGSSITSGTWTIYITKDGGTQTTIAGSATHEGNGQWTFNLTASEMDAAVVTLRYTHTDASPAEDRLITAPFVSGTAQAGASTTITLASGASATDSLYVGDLVLLNDGQCRIITGYVGSTKVATVDRAWTTNPTSSSTYVLLPAAADLRTISGAAVSTSTAQLGVNAVNIGGTAQTGRDLGASVLISSGTGTGQLSVTSGVIAANVTQFGGAAGTFSGGRPEVNTTHAAGTAWGSGAITAASIATDAITAAKLAADAASEIAAAVAANLGTGSGLTALASASNLAIVAGYIDTEVAAIKAKTDNLPSSPAATGDVTALLTTTMTESYAADGAAPTLTQALMAILQRLTEFGTSGTTITVKKLDGSTTAMTLTLNDATTPTSVTRTG